MYFQIYLRTPSLLSFFKLWLSLLRNMQNKEYNYQGAERERREKEREQQLQKSKSIAKQNMVRAHSFIGSARKV